MRSARNNTVAGLLVLSTLIATVVIVMALSSSWDSFGRRSYTVEFGLEEGVTGLATGSGVFLGGREIGVVDRVRFDPSAEQPERLLVEISVDRRIQLRDGAVAQLNMPLLGGGSTINFPAIGDGEPLDDSDVIDGGIATAGFLSQAGYGPEQSEQLKRIMARADEITRQINDALAEFRAMTEDARAVLADARERSPEWFDRVDSITENVDATSRRGPEIADDLEERIEQVSRLIASAQSAIDENRADIDATIDNARSMSERGNEFLDTLNNELRAEFEGVLEESRLVIEEARGAVERVNDAIGEQVPSVRRTLANARLASDQLTATLAEVRRSPWRLLYRPDKRELEFELLYDSARAYAGAVSDLRAASEALQALSAASADPRRADELASELDDAFDAYREAEQRFLDLVARHASEGE